MTEYLFRDPLAPWIVHSYPQLYTKSVDSKGILCYSTVTKEVGEVICRQMKEQFLSKVLMGTQPTQYRGHFYFGLVECTGDESHLFECKMHVNRVTQCLDGYAMIECNPGTYKFPKHNYASVDQKISLLFNSCTRSCTRCGSAKTLHSVAVLH